MERLTARAPSGHPFYPKCFEQCDGYPYDKDCLCCTLEDDIAEKLASYEDTGLEPEEIMAIKDGKVVVDLALDGDSEDVKYLRALLQTEKERGLVFRKALDTYGAEAQTLMVFEEMAELQKELSKHARGKDNTMEIAEEIADVQIMLDQMIILHDCADEVKGFRIAKLLRLAEKLEEGTE